MIRAALGAVAGHDDAGPVVWNPGRMSLSVLIVDDHEVFRLSARALLEADGLVVVGEAADGAEALAATARLRPDIVLLDIALPDLDGFGVAERLAHSSDPPAVVLVSSRAAATYGPKLLTAPARGFLSKDELSGPALLRLVG
jgi:DNA-binding NarL/FixJ family response regulator